MKRIKHLLAILLLASASNLLAQNYGNALPATDALGRRMPDAEQVGGKREKYVGLFYWTWHTNFAHMDVCVPSEFIAKAPEAAYDYKLLAELDEKKNSLEERLLEIYEEI